MSCLYKELCLALSHSPLIYGPTLGLVAPLLVTTDFSASPLTRNELGCNATKKHLPPHSFLVPCIIKARNKHTARLWKIKIIQLTNFVIAVVLVSFCFADASNWTPKTSQLYCHWPSARQTSPYKSKPATLWSDGYYQIRSKIKTSFLHHVEWIKSKKAKKPAASITYLASIDLMTRQLSHCFIFIIVVWFLKLREIKFFKHSSLL